MGQYLSYRLALDTQDPNRELYLAVPLDTFTTFFALPFVQAAIRRHTIKVFVYNPEMEEIVQWIS